MNRYAMLFLSGFLRHMNNLNHTGKAIKNVDYVYKRKNHAQEHSSDYDKRDLG